MERGWGAKTEEGEPANENDSDSPTSSSLPPVLLSCPQHFALATYHLSLLYLPMCCHGWNPVWRPRLHNVLHITEPIYLCGHIHIFIHSHSHQALHRETLNQDSPFKQTNELWITPLHKLPAQSITETERLEGWKEKKRRDRGRLKNIMEIEEQEQKAGWERKQGVWDRKQQRGRHRGGEGEKQRGKESVWV